MNKKTGWAEILIVCMLAMLAACSGGGGGGSAAVPAQILFEENSNIYSVKENGSASSVAVADTLEIETTARWVTGYDATRNTNYYTGDPYSQPMVQNGRAVYRQRYNTGYDDIYAANLDGSQRVSLAATADMEKPFAMVGDRLIYTVMNTSTFNQNLRSVRLDGSGDVAITTLPFPDRAAAVAFVGTKLIFTEYTGVTGNTYICDADGSNRVTLWNKSLYSVQVSGNRLVLFAGTQLAAVNLDGTGFVALATNANGGGASITYSGQSPFFGIAAGRVFYNSIDTSTTPSTIRLHSVALDGTNPLVLASSTTVYPHVMSVSGSKLIVNENTGSAFNIVSYDISQADSRLLLLGNHKFMFQSGNRLAGFMAGNTVNTYIVSAVNLDGSELTLLTPEINPVDIFHLGYTSNGKFIYSHKAASGQIEGYSVNLDGTGTTLLTTAAGDKELMAILGNRLVYQSYATGNTSATRNLYGVNLDGTGAIDYATTSADERYLGKFADKLLYTSLAAGNVEMKLVPAAGGAAVTLQSSANGKSFIGAF